MAKEVDSIFPIIDLSDFKNNKEKVSAELGRAARDIGFFRVKGHGISEERIARAFELGKKWFALSYEEKLKSRLDLQEPGTTEYVGWKGELVLLNGSDRPKLEQMVLGHPAKDNVYANKLEEQAKEVVPGIEVQEFTREFLDDLLYVCQTILRGLAIALGQAEEFFIKGLSRDLPDIAGGGGWNYYLPFSSTSKDTEWRIPAHADAELFTLLFQQIGQPGLEVTSGKAFFEKVNNGKPFLKNYEKIPYPSSGDLQFYPMPPVAGTITVNVGDFLMRYSDGEYLSTYHRVRSPTPNNGIPEVGFFTKPGHAGMKDDLTIKSVCNIDKQKRACQNSAGK